MNKSKQYKYLDLLIFLSITTMACVNVMAGKIVEIGIFTLSAASLCIPLTYIAGDLLTEVYGYKQSRRAAWILIFTSILTTILFQLAVVLPPAPGFKGNDAYIFVLSQVPRLVVAGWIALFIGQLINDFVLAKMKIAMKGRYLWMRTIGSTMVGQAADTSLFYLIALYNVIPNDLLIQSILSGWFLKVVIEVAMTPVTYVVVNKLKNIEKEDYYDRHTNFNPLIVQLKNMQK
jgi:queuosine precursor transporter